MGWPSRCLNYETIAFCDVLRGAWDPHITYPPSSQRFARRMPQARCQLHDMISPRVAGEQGAQFPSSTFLFVEGQLGRWLP